MGGGGGWEVKKSDHFPDFFFFDFLFCNCFLEILVEVLGTWGTGRGGPGAKLNNFCF